MTTQYRLFLIIGVIFCFQAAFGANDFQCPLDESVSKQYEFIQVEGSRVDRELAQFYVKGGSDQELKGLIQKVSCLTQLSPRPFWTENLYLLKGKYLQQFRKVLSQVSMGQVQPLLRDFKNIERNEVRVGD